MDKGKIAELWAAGKSFSQIAEEIGVTRSAVAGQVSRMRASGLIAERPQDHAASTRERVASGEHLPARARRPAKVITNPIAAALRDPILREQRRLEREARIRMDHVEHQPIEKIADKVVMPGIDKHLVPLCLYMGTRSFGRIHRWWNFTLAAMEQGCDTLTDIVKLSHHPDYSHLCGTETKVNRLSAQGFFTRLRDNPQVTNNIPHMTEWAREILPHGFIFRRVPLETFEKNAAPWRRFVLRPRARNRKGGGNIKQIASSACYPYIAHDPKKEGFDLVSKVNKAVPRGLPEEIRADICQDIICAILSGQMTEADLQGSVKDFVAQGRKMFVNKWDFLSLDAEVPGLEGVTYLDGLSGDINGDWEMNDDAEMEWGEAA